MLISGLRKYSAAAFSLLRALCARGVHSAVCKSMWADGRGRFSGGGCVDRRSLQITGRAFRSAVSRVVLLLVFLLHSWAAKVPACHMAGFRAKPEGAPCDPVQLADWFRGSENTIFPRSRSIRKAGAVVQYSRVSEKLAQRQKQVRTKEVR